MRTRMNELSRLGTCDTKQNSIPFPRSLDETESALLARTLFRNKSKWGIYAIRHCPFRHSRAVFIVLVRRILSTKD